MNIYGPSIAGESNLENTRATGSFTGSFSGDGSNLTGIESYWTLSGSNAIEHTGSIHVGGDAAIEGTLTVQELHLEYISSSIIYESGSTKFGDTLDDIHSFTGSLQVSASNSFFSGSVSISETGSGHFSGSFEGDGTNLIGAEGPQGPQGTVGPQGYQGYQGPQGPEPTVSPTYGLLYSNPTFPSNLTTGASYVTLTGYSGGSSSTGFTVSTSTGRITYTGLGTVTCRIEFHFQGDFADGRTCYFKLLKNTSLLTGTDVAPTSPNGSGFTELPLSVPIITIDTLSTNQYVQFQYQTYYALRVQSVRFIITKL